MTDEWKTRTSGAHQVSFTGDFYQLETVELDAPPPPPIVAVHHIGRTNDARGKPAVILRFTNRSTVSGRPIDLVPGDRHSSETGQSFRRHRQDRGQAPGIEVRPTARFLHRRILLHKVAWDAPPTEIVLTAARGGVRHERNPWIFIQYDSIPEGSGCQIHGSHLLMRSGNGAVIERPSFLQSLRDIENLLI